MGFWSGYWRSLKPLTVEEPVDVWIHRPAGYLIAKATFPTPITPNQITGLSILFAIAGGAVFMTKLPFHGLIGFGCLFLSAAFDCADGMLARMRKSSSAFGRMLDGVADLASIIAAAAGSMYVMLSLYWDVPWQAAIVGVLAAITIWTSSFHTAAYDHYKNVYLRVVHGILESEDLEDAEARAVAAKILPATTIWERIEFAVYLLYVREQHKFIKKLDPFTKTALRELQTDERAKAIYAKHCEPPMRMLRNYFGFGALMFGTGLFTGLGRPDYFMAFRLVLLNALFFFYFRPMQLRASKAAFEEIAALVKETS